MPEHKTHFIDKIWLYSKEHPAVAMTCLAGYLSSLGLLYQTFLLNRFDIAALNFISTADLFLAFIQAIPIIGVILLVHIALIPTAMLFSIFFRKEKGLFAKAVGLWKAVWRGELLTSFFASFAIAAAAGHVHAGSIAREGLLASFTTTCVKVPDDTDFVNWLVVTSSSSYVFLHHPDRGTLALKRAKMPIASICHANKGFNRTPESSAAARPDGLGGRAG